MNLPLFFHEHVQRDNTCLRARCKDANLYISLLLVTLSFLAFRILVTRVVPHYLCFKKNKRSRLSASVYVNVYFLNRAQHCTVHVILDYNNNIMRLIFSDYWTGLIEIQDRRKKGSLFLRICSILKILRLVVTDKHSHSTFLVLTNIRKI